MKINPVTSELDLVRSPSSLESDGETIELSLSQDSENGNVEQALQNGDQTPFTMQLEKGFVKKGIDFTTLNTVVIVPPLAGLWFCAKELLLFVNSVTGDTDNTYTMQLRYSDDHSVIAHLTGGSLNTDDGEKHYFRFDLSNLYASQDDFKALDLSRGIEAYVHKAVVATTCLKNLILKGDIF